MTDSSPVRRRARPCRPRTDLFVPGGIAGTAGIAFSPPATAVTTLPGAPVFGVEPAPFQAPPGAADPEFGASETWPWPAS
jgi:hypothetical protein